MLFPTPYVHASSHNFGESWDGRAAARRKAPSGQTNGNAENTRFYKNVIVVLKAWVNCLSFFGNARRRSAQCLNSSLKMIIWSRERNLTEQRLVICYPNNQLEYPDNSGQYCAFVRSTRAATLMICSAARQPQVLRPDWTKDFAKEHLIIRQGNTIAAIGFSLKNADTRLKSGIEFKIVPLSEIGQDLPKL